MVTKVQYRPQMPWIASGREVARVIAAQPRFEQKATLATMVEWYEGFAKQPLPANFREQVEFAQSRPDIFENLFSQGVCPLDAGIIDASASNIQIRTAVEIVRVTLDECSNLRNTDSTGKFHIALSCIKERIISSGSGPKTFPTLSISRTLLSDYRPELIPYVRFHNFAKKIEKSKTEKRNWLLDHDFSRENINPHYNFRSPGFYTSATLQGHTARSPRELYRLGWVKFESAELALEHLLAGRERCGAAISNPELSLHRVARVASGQSLKKITVFPDATIVQSRKLYVGTSAKMLSTFSGHPSDESVHGFYGNVLYYIKSSRAFPVPTGFSNEAEYGLPVVLNPGEVFEMIHYSQNRSVQIRLYWRYLYKELCANFSCPDGLSQSFTYRFVSNKVGYVRDE